ncbi:hypothetical protein BGW39_004568 [Mortierella sp. 14UC]|nr:hypothetical protein BGW39_004568 [Mortierella sp. 14UC]
MLEHCPNIRELGTPTLMAIVNSDTLVRDIARFCPKLSDLSIPCRSRTHGPTTDGTMTFQVLDALTPQQVKHLCCEDWAFETPLLDMVSLFRRHSSTLQRLILEGCRAIDFKALQVLLMEGRGLEMLHMRWMNKPKEICIHLEEAIEYP